ncbi:hypothetical protein EDB86DRAFT_3245749 [Lactarius hatsudake]|nr:hypothetical protein EDB86DRAFT_3245749 [Lactarius hatsudake]
MPSAIIDAPFSLRPTKILENADKLMEHTRALYENYEQIMKPIDRTVAEDKMTLANDFRHGVEGKSWLAQAEQAKLFFNQAQDALATVKRCVDEAIETSWRMRIKGRERLEEDLRSIEGPKRSRYPHVERPVTNPNPPFPASQRCQPSLPFILSVASASPVMGPQILYAEERADRSNGDVGGNGA